MQPDSFLYYVGVDGGGTHCRVRIVDANGRCCAEAQGGSANLYQQGYNALRTIEDTIAQAFTQISLAPDALPVTLARTSVGLGLAGAELPESQALIAQWQHPYSRIQVNNDAHIACLGAHSGEEGGLVIVGTGIVAWAIQHDRTIMLDGWGFPLADQGSGAWLGMRAIQESLRASDGVRPRSPLTDRILAHFGQTPRAIPGWARDAHSSDFGQFARWVVQAFENGDALAQQLVQEQAYAVGLLVQRLANLNVSRIALLGGLGPFVGTELVSHLRPLIVPAQQDPLAGALLMIRQEAKP
ncbi:BadF/BadG/BcrA/BcrD ATPase family protein [Salinispirillum marinum]|uniref:BadF/BadG/BcrA/BcrD ATPase family protein n=2 Tax=Saccharospirillaceae TaxID=255527 RepID=A0ABV8BJL9_9GAMM